MDSEYTPTLVPKLLPVEVLNDLKTRWFLLEHCASGAPRYMKMLLEHIKALEGGKVGQSKSKRTTGHHHGRREKSRGRQVR